MGKYDARLEKLERRFGMAQFGVLRVVLSGHCVACGRDDRACQCPRPGASAVRTLLDGNGVVLLP